MNTTLIITFTTKPEKQADFRQFLASVKINLPKAKGCQGVTVFNDSHNRNRFTLVERWDSEAAHQQHVEKVIQSGDWEAIAAYLDAEPESAYYTEL